MTKVVAEEVEVVDVDEGDMMVDIRVDIIRKTGGVVVDIMTTEVSCQDHAICK